MVRYQNLTESQSHEPDREAEESKNTLIHANVFMLSNVEIKDGSVTFDELTTAKAGFPREAFDRADRNKDGVISTDDTKKK